MCSIVIFHDMDCRSATNQGELAAIIGNGSLVMEEGAAYHDGDCLCPVNLPSTAEKAGYVHSSRDGEGEHDPFDFHWRKA